MAKEQFGSPLKVTEKYPTTSNAISQKLKPNTSSIDDALLKWATSRGAPVKPTYSYIRFWETVHLHVAHEKWQGEKTGLKSKKQMIALQIEEKAAFHHLFTADKKELKQNPISIIKSHFILSTPSKMSLTTNIAKKPHNSLKTVPLSNKFLQGKNTNRQFARWAKKRDIFVGDTSAIRFWKDVSDYQNQRIKQWNENNSSEEIGSTEWKIMTLMDKAFNAAFHDFQVYGDKLKKRKSISQSTMRPKSMKNANVKFDLPECRKIGKKDIMWARSNELPANEDSAAIEFWASVYFYQKTLYNYLHKCGCKTRREMHSLKHRVRYSMNNSFNVVYEDFKVCYYSIRRRRSRNMRNGETFNYLTVYLGLQLFLYLFFIVAFVFIEVGKKHNV